MSSPNPAKSNEYTVLLNGFLVKIPHSPRYKYTTTASLKYTILHNAHLATLYLKMH